MPSVGRYGVFFASLQLRIRHIRLCATCYLGPETCGPSRFYANPACPIGSIDGRSPAAKGPTPVRQARWRLLLGRVLGMPHFIFGPRKNPAVTGDPGPRSERQSAPSPNRKMTGTQSHHAPRECMLPALFLSVIHEIPSCAPSIGIESSGSVELVSLETLHVAQKPRKLWCPVFSGGLLESQDSLW